MAHSPAHNGQPRPAQAVRLRWNDPWIVLICRIDGRFQLGLLEARMRASLPSCGPPTGRQGTTGFLSGSLTDQDRQVSGRSSRR
jgi:hypothetical protein